MTHDPMCPTIETGFDTRCQCDLIAKVRADERGLSDEAIFNDGQRAMLAKCIALVEGTYTVSFVTLDADFQRAALVALRALQEKP